MERILTQCPNCASLFKVSLSQLQQADGMARCGSCLHKFKVEDEELANQLQDDVDVDFDNIDDELDSIFDDDDLDSELDTEIDGEFANLDEELASLSNQQQLELPEASTNDSDEEEFNLDSDFQLDDEVHQSLDQVFANTESSQQTVSAEQQDSELLELSEFDAENLFEDIPGNALDEHSVEEHSGGLDNDALELNDLFVDDQVEAASQGANSLESEVLLDSDFDLDDEFNLEDEVDAADLDAELEDFLPGMADGDYDAEEQDEGAEIVSFIEEQDPLAEDIQLATDSDIFDGFELLEEQQKADFEAAEDELDALFSEFEQQQDDSDATSALEPKQASEAEKVVSLTERRSRAKVRSVESGYSDEITRILENVVDDSETDIPVSLAGETPAPAPEKDLIEHDVDADEFFYDDAGSEEELLHAFDDIEDELDEPLDVNVGDAITNDESPELDLDLEEDSAPLDHLEIEGNYNQDVLQEIEQASFPWEQEAEKAPAKAQASQPQSLNSANPTSTDKAFVAKMSKEKLVDPFGIEDISYELAADPFDEDVLYDDTLLADELELGSLQNAKKGSSSARYMDNYDVNEYRNLKRFLWFLGSLLLAATLVLQYVWFNRTSLQNDPLWGDVVAEFCQFVPCQLQPRKAPDLISVQSKMVTGLEYGEQVLSFKLVLANMADFDQPFPTIVVLFSDHNGAKLATAHVLPKQYLAEERLRQMMAAKTDTRIAFQLPKPSQTVSAYSISFK